MYWFDPNWQQDLTPVDQDVGNSWPHLNNNERSSWNDTDLKMNLNLTVDYCEKIYINETVLMKEDFCSATTDGLLCWPPTSLNKTAYVKCFSEFMGVRYNESQNVSRLCLASGNWSKPNYSSCTEIFSVTDVETQTTIYIVGYIISLITLLIAFGIFAYFKELRCLRNVIHMHLMCAYMLMYCMWILTLTVVVGNEGSCPACIFIVTLLQYFLTSTFFWMFVEGLYLYILVVQTLRRENFKLRIYVCIGWGLPMFFIVIWCLARGFWPENDDSGSSLWFNIHPIDWIYIGPVLIILLANLIFLVAIMWVLITKLRSANTVETQQYRKAVKALLVLMPLLGVTYVIMIKAPTGDPHSIKIFDSTRAVLFSTQGFTVALFYCFLNTEVQNTVRHHFDNCKAQRSLQTSRARRGSNGRTRTESMRHTEWTLVSSEDVDIEMKDPEHSPSNGRII